MDPKDMKNQKTKRREEDVEEKVSLPVEAAAIGARDWQVLSVVLFHC
jgi:hypothetical protein